MAIIYPGAEEFMQLLADKKTFIADFFASWCGPCRMQDYILKDFDKATEGSLLVVKMDIDKMPELTDAMQVNIIPALLYVRDGVIVSRSEGFVPLGRMRRQASQLTDGRPYIEPAPSTSYDLIIIGGGAAGLTATIYACRAGLKVLVLEAFAPGGKLIKTFELANWPGAKLVNGSQLAYNIYDQAMALGCTYLYETVTAITPHANHFHYIDCASGHRFSAPAVITATGTVERRLGLPHEDELIGRGLSYCAVCDAAFYRNKPVIVIGSGNAAFEESLYLAEFASAVTIVTRTEQYSAERIIQERVLEHPKINVLNWHEAQEFVLEKGKIAGLRVRNTHTWQVETLPAKGIFPYIGADPATAFCAPLGITDKQGYLVVKADMSTAVPGIFAAGDACAKVLRQVVTATNDGAIAAQSAVAYLHPFHGS